MATPWRILQDQKTEKLKRRSTEKDHDHLVKTVKNIKRRSPSPDRDNDHNKRYKKEEKGNYKYKNRSPSRSHSYSESFSYLLHLIEDEALIVAIVKE